MKAGLPPSEWEEEGSFYSTVFLKVALLLWTSQFGSH